MNEPKSHCKRAVISLSDECTTDKHRTKPNVSDWVVSKYSRVQHHLPDDGVFLVEMRNEF